MEKKESNNKNNNANEPNKDNGIEETFNDNKSSELDTLINELDEFDTEFHCDYEDYLQEIDEDPLSFRIPVGPELQKLGIQNMVLFEKILIITTEDGMVLLKTTNEESHSYYIPLQNPPREHARALQKTTTSLLNAEEFNYSIRERMNGA